MKTFKEQQETKITLSIPDVGEWSVTEYELRKNIRDFIIRNTPTKSSIGKSAYGEGVMYQYYRETPIDDILDSNNNYNNPFNEFMEKVSELSQYYEEANNVVVIIYNLLEDELIKDYKQAAELLRFRNKKELKIKEVFCDKPKGKPIQVSIYQIN